MSRWRGRGVGESVGSEIGDWAGLDGCIMECWKAVWSAGEGNSKCIGPLSAMTI